MASVRQPFNSAERGTVIGRRQGTPLRHLFLFAEPHERPVKESWYFAQASRTALTPAGIASAGFLVDAFPNITARVAGALSNTTANRGFLGSLSVSTPRYLQFIVGQFALGG
jgi:hypothetical protein